MKAISPLLSWVILILIAVVIAMVFAPWLYNLLKEHSSTIGDTTSEELRCQYAGLYIDSVTFNCSNDCSSGTAHNITLKVINSGAVTLAVDKFSIVNDKGQTFRFNVTYTNLLSGDIAYITNITTTSCYDINNTMNNNGYVYIGSLNCSMVAYYSFPGSNINFVDC